MAGPGCVAGDGIVKRAERGRFWVLAALIGTIRGWGRAAMGKRAIRGEPDA
jgi:hypothetical protein